VKCLYLYSSMISFLRVTTTESMIPRPCFQASNHHLFNILLHVYLLPYLFRLLLPLIFIHITCILLSLRRTSAPIHLTSVLGVLGTQETSCIIIARLLERDMFDLYLPEFNKPWVIHLNETCCCSTNLCTWRSNTVYKNRSVRRHQRPTRRWPKPSSGSFTNDTRSRSRSIKMWTL
jgi:hypothetical protein